MNKKILIVGGLLGISSMYLLTKYIKKSLKFNNLIFNDLFTCNKY